MTEQQVRPAGWYRTMEDWWATEMFGAPANPVKGQEWTASDGSVWVYQLSGTPWWEISQYVPAEYWRGKLAVLLRRCERPHGYGGDEYDHRADTILTEGWRPPSRLIRTAEQLMREADGTALRFAGGEFGAINTASGRWPGRVNLLRPHAWLMPDEFTADHFPALVLWEPGDGHA